MRVDEISACNIRVYTVRYLTYARIHTCIYTRVYIIYTDEPIKLYNTLLPIKAANKYEQATSKQHVSFPFRPLLRPHASGSTPELLEPGGALGVQGPPQSGLVKAQNS